MRKEGRGREELPERVLPWEGRRMKDKKVRPKAHFNIPRKVSGNSVGVLAAEVKTRKNANCDLLRKGWA